MHHIIVNTTHITSRAVVHATFATLEFKMEEEKTRGTGGQKHQAL